MLDALFDILVGVLPQGRGRWLVVSLVALAVGVGVIFYLASG